MERHLQMISIIIPVYNVEAYIENSLKSVFNQTYTDYEIILVDDGSRDKSIEIAQKLIENHSFKNCTIITEENSGQGVARNAGMLRASGEWLYFMDPDDLIPTDALSVLLEVAEKTTADMTFCEWRYSRNGLIEERKGEYKFSQYTSGEIQLAFLLRKKKILVPGTLFRRTWLLNENIVFPQLRFSEDINFLWNAIAKAERVAEVDYCLYIYMVRGNSTMTSSKLSHIKQSYDGLCRVNDAFQKDGRVTEEVKRWMLSRWVFGIMRASAGVMKWTEYKALIEQLSYKKHCRDLQGFPDLKVGLMRKIFLCSPKMFYVIAARWNPYI